MRAIDGDALKDRFESLAYDDWNQGVSTSWADAYRQAAEIVEEMPTIELERKTGKWLKAYGDHEAFGVRPFYRYCSECNESTVFPYNFCPHCGADMRGDKHEAD